MKNYVPFTEKLIKFFRFKLDLRGIRKLFFVVVSGEIPVNTKTTVRFICIFLIKEFIDCIN